MDFNSWKEKLKKYCKEYRFLPVILVADALCYLAYLIHKYQYELTLKDAVIIIPILAVCLSYITYLHRKEALKQNTLFALHQHSLTSNMFDKFLIIKRLKVCKSYEEFCQYTTRAEQKEIFRLITFLNYAAEPVDKQIYSLQDIWDSYFWMYRLCWQKLGSWWIEHQRRDGSVSFEAYEFYAGLASEKTSGQITAFDWERRRMRLKQKDRLKE